MRPALVATLVLSTAAPLAAGDDFRFVSRRIESHYHAERLKIPLFGLARWFAKPLGVHALDLAIWEDLSYRQIRQGDLVRPFAAELSRRGWKPMIRVHSPGREAVHIYAKPDGKSMRLLLLTVDNQTVMVHAKVDARRLSRILGEPRLAAARMH